MNKMAKETSFYVFLRRCEFKKWMKCIKYSIKCYVIGVPRRLQRCCFEAMGSINKGNIW